MAEKKKTPSKKPFYKPNSIARGYERDLRTIAREVGRIISGFQEKANGKIKGALGGVSAMQKTLEDYARILGPWAKVKGAEIAAQADRADRKAWEAATAEMSIGIKNAVRYGSVAQTFRGIMQEQVRLITSLPVEAGQRVHKLVITGMEDSQRADEVAKEIMRSGEVTQARAMLIARTETTRAATAFTQARSTSIGSQGYIWRTAHDSDVRPSHREMEGKYVAWNNPPTLDGLTGHAGALPNCRCYPEPVIPESLF